MDFWKQKRTSGPLFGKRTQSGDTATESQSSVKLTVAKPETQAATQSAGKTSTTSMKISSTTPAPAKSSTMSQAALKFDHDLACGVMVGALAIPGMVVTVEAVERTDPSTQRTERTQEWLRTNDMLAILTRTYGTEQARLASLTIRPDTPPHARSQMAKERDELTRRLNELREQVVCLLHSRRAYHKAKELGITILIQA